VGELPLELQAKLLRVLESGEVKRVGSNRSFRVDVRVVAATHRDLLTEVSQGRLEVEVKFNPAALKKLKEHSWPGNVRELRNVVQRALLLREGPLLDTDVLTFEPSPKQGPEAPGRAPRKLPEGMTLQQLLEQVERECVEDALRSCDYQRGKAARRLGLSRTSLFERMKAWGYGNEGQEAR
jgi:DNA-binding NtrC family response regulator